MDVGYARARVTDAGGEVNRLLPPFYVFPTDLRTWLAENQLKQIVAEAARHADHSGVRPEFTPHWESLLVRTAAAYTVGIFSSDEIALLPGEPPLDSGAAIRHFRRCNKSVLARTLASTLQTCAEKYHSGAAPWSSSMDSSLCEAEARARMARAIEMDSWSVDDD